MPIPISYQVRKVIGCCVTCEFSSRANGRLYCRFQEPSITAVVMDRSNIGRNLSDVLECTRVDENGICGEYKEMSS